MHRAALDATMAVLLASFAILVVAAPVAATVAGHDDDNPYREVRINWEDVQTYQSTILSLQLEPMGYEMNTWVHYLVRNQEIEQLGAVGVPFTVIHDDLETFYASRYPEDDYGIFHTYDETIAFLDQLHADYPDITTEKIAFGATWEGRYIYAMKISDNPTLEEPDEPEVLFDAMHHAREIMTVEVLIDYMTWLCENYGTDPDATQLVDTRQIWFVPLVNVDGFVYNEQQSPNGGGMWRKNRRNDLGGCIGVDPNRNYPYQWGYDNSGSSPDPCSETYRGPSAGSEWCNQSLMMLINQHEFVVLNSYHSVVGIVLYPWGYIDGPTPDEELYQAMCAQMTVENGYTCGRPAQLLYPVNGGSFDWTYGEEVSKPKIISFSSEIAGSGFWPAEGEVPGLLAENHYANVYLTRAAGVFLTLTDYAVVGGNANGRLDPGETADLVVTVMNIGAIAEAHGVAVTLASADPYLALNSAQSPVGSIPAGSSGDNSASPFTLTAAAATPEGHVADLSVEIIDNAGFATTQTLTLVIGEPQMIHGTDFEVDTGGWEQDATHTATTGAFVRIDPNPTQFQPGDDTTPPPGIYAWVTGQNSSLGSDDVDGGISASHSAIFDLSGLTSARLDMNWFHGQRDAGDDPGDFFSIDLSDDGGASYPVNLVAIGDVTHQATWNSLVVDLEDVIPLTSQMRVRVQAADGVASGDIVEGGIDDFFILDAGTGNEAPGAPTLSSPPNGAGNQPATPTLIVNNAVDPEGDPLTYTFRVYADPLLTTVVAEVEGVTEGGGTTSWTVSPPLGNSTYYWRAYAADQEFRGPYMAAASFEVTGSTAVADAGAAPGRPVLGAPTPNPFSVGAQVTYSLPERGRVRVDIYDVNGRHVLRLVEGVAEAGRHLRHWNGRTTAGEQAPAGMYLVQLHVGGVRLTQKLIRLP